MKSIAWAIFCAAFVMQPKRLPTDDGFHFNNTMDVLFFLIGFAFLIISTTKADDK